MSHSPTSFADVFHQPNYKSLFAVQFLGAFNDNLFKNALVILITFKLSQQMTETGLMITLAAGLFILPFFLFSAMAGQLADKYPKALLIKKIKLAEVLIMLIGGLALLNQDLWLLFFTLFLMGTQSAFFGPIKYSILPEIMPENHLVKANGIFSGSTFIAILIGTIFGGIGIMLPDGELIMASAVILVAGIGYGFSLFLYSDQTKNGDIKIDYNPLQSTWQVIQATRDFKLARFAVYAISWFWFIGAVLLSQIPALVKYELFADDNVVVLFLTLFSVGIAIGSTLVARQSDFISLRWHWVWLASMSLCLLLTVVSIQATDFADLQKSLSVSRETFFTIEQFIAIYPLNLTMLFLALLAILGGAYIVPLYTLLQTQTPEFARARMVAVNNIVNSFLMVLSAVLIMIGFAVSLSLLNMLLILAGLNLLVAWLVFGYRHSKNFIQ
ncbi:MFS transporter [Thiomicrorhabdus sediminis]|uniref:MFS transporter n=1 Tax=Thiomicrorhabdus sediminis TaxID=2580412 RepID=A0A4V1HHI8_9GAMM|nr:MFS transporter [Thiomicrorhabdus sediminis]QCU89173.1 MFS transporter [Thiomicrorhabdus sediminis]